MNFLDVKYCQVTFDSSSKRYMYKIPNGALQDLSKIVSDDLRPGNLIGESVIVETYDTCSLASLDSFLSEEVALKKLKGKKARYLLGVTVDYLNLFYSFVDQSVYHYNEYCKDEIFSIHKKTKYCFTDPQTGKSRLQSKPIKGENNMKTKLTTSLKDSAKVAKDTAIQIQVGNAVNTAIKKSLLELPAIPDQVKFLLDKEPWASLVIGLVLKTATDTLDLESPAVKKAVDAAYFTSSVELSKHFTFVSDYLEAVIEKAAGKLVKVEASEETD